MTLDDLLERVNDLQITNVPLYVEIEGKLTPIQDLNWGVLKQGKVREWSTYETYDTEDELVICFTPSLIP